MKKGLIAIVLVVACTYGAMWLMVVSMEERYRAREWPEHLGTIEDVAKRYPNMETNVAAAVLTKQLPGVDIEAVKEPLGRYEVTELERVGDQVQPPAGAVAGFLAQHDAALDAVRDHILTSGPLRWETKLERAHDAPLPNLLKQMQLTKLFTARALAKAANHDATAWDDLHAIWLLDRALWQRPELISTLIALSGSRMVNAAAAKMPLPVPAWFAEVQSFDYRHNFAASYQAEAWMSRHTPLHALERPFLDACALDMAEQMRVWTNELAANGNCDLSPVKPIAVASWNLMGKVATPNLAAAWQRFARFRAEREATDKILALRAGQTPPAQTACSDGTWTVAANEVKFSRDIAVRAPGINYPLVYRR